jgi:hypothetical protein
MNNINLFETQSLNIVKSAHILTKDDLNTIYSLSKELSNTFQTAQVFRTQTEAEISVLNDIKFPTPDSKYWQSIREQNVHFGELVRLSFNYRRNNVEIAKLEGIIKKAQGYDRDLLQIDLEEKLFNRIEMERVAKERIREIKMWSDIMAKLKPEMKFSLTDVNEHQLISYTQRFISTTLATEACTNKDLDSYRNLMAQFDKAVKVCRERGVMDKVLMPYLESERAKEMFGEEMIELKLLEA